MHHEKYISRVLPTFMMLGALVATLVWSTPSLAARITTLSKTGKTVLIDSEGMELKEGEKFFVMIDGKKKAIVVILEVNRGKAKGKITKGKAALDATLEPTKKSSSTAASDNSGEDPGSSDESPMPKRKGRKGDDGGSSTGPRTYVGVLGGYAMDSQNVSGSATASMTGSGYSIKAFGDIPLSSSIGVIARSGLEQVNFAGSVGSLAVNTAILYFTADLLLRYSFTSHGFMPYIGGGLGLHYPLSKSSNILNQERIASTFVFFLPIGFNMQMGKSTIFTAAAEYAMFPPSSEVSTYFYTLRFGLGWKW